MSLPKPCRRCGKPGKAVCDGCQQAAESARPTRQARGYDAEYDRNRSLIVAAVIRDPSVLCCLCYRPFTGCLTRDISAEHLIPLRYGGTSDLSNLAPAHFRCNSNWRSSRKKG